MWSMFLLDMNRLRGPLPDAIGTWSDLQIYNIGINLFTGTLPDSWAALPGLLGVFVGLNLLHGSLPSILFTVTSLRGIIADGNRLRGTLPEQVMALQSLERWQLSLNQHTGSLPEKLRTLTKLERLVLSYNMLAGTLSGSALAGQQGLSKLVLEHNLFGGSIPDRVIHMQSLTFLNLGYNGLQSSIPDSVLVLRHVEQVMLIDNYLTGALPAGSASTPELAGLDFAVNRLIGTMPDTLAGAGNLKWVFFQHNALEGCIPEAVVTLRDLAVLVVSGNKLLGALPWEKQLLKSGTNFKLQRLFAGDNCLEGTVPQSLALLASLNALDISGRSMAHMPRLQGALPPGFSRAGDLDRLFAQNQALDGNIPRFPASMLVIALHGNSLVALPPFHLRTKDAVALLHQNRLSCDVPLRACVSGIPKMTLVANGNRFFEPAHFPSWILPFERASLLWAVPCEGYWLAAKATASGLFLAITVSRKFGSFRSLLLAERRLQAAAGRRGVLGQVLAQLRRALAYLSVMGSCLVHLYIHEEYYACPNSFALLGAYLSAGAWSQRSIAVAWIHMCWQTRLSWWNSVTVSLSGRKNWKGCLSRCLIWIAWFVVVASLSSLVAVQVAAQSVPNLLSLPEAWVKVIAVCIGLCQGIITGVVLPHLACIFSRASGSPEALISAGQLLSTCLLPAIVVIILDGSCMAHWTRWWQQCNRDSTPFKVSLSGENDHHDRMEMWTNISALSARDVCAPSMAEVSIRSCARSVISKLQDIVLSKLVSVAFIIPAYRLQFGVLIRSTADGVIQLAMLFHYTLIFGVTLPLTFPLLLMGVSSLRMLVIVAMDAAILEAKPVRGIAVIGALLALSFSAALHAYFVDSDFLACGWIVCGAPVVVASSLKVEERDVHPQQHQQQTHRMVRINSAKSACSVEQSPPQAGIASRRISTDSIRSMHEAVVSGIY